jgi:hypothetical protein
MASRGDTSRASGAPRNAEASASETPSARQFASWLAAFNSRDREQLLAYHQKNFPYEAASRDVADIDREFDLSTGTGGFELKQSESATTTFNAILKERRSDQFAHAAMEVAAAEPHRVVHFQIHPIPTPDEFLSKDEREASQVDDAKRRLLIDGIARELQAHYVFPEKAQDMIVALREHVARGDYDKITRSQSFADTITTDLREVSHDLHLRFEFGRRPARARAEPTRDERLRWLRGINFGFGAIERLKGNVARVVIDGFPPSEDDEARNAIAGLMSQVADARALLVDLRENHGGSPETVALVASYLFDEAPVHLNDIFSRDTGSTKQYWTVRDLRGERFGGKKPVYVLTSRQTFSGGEELAYDLQCLHRARLIGEMTGGGANPAGPRDLDEWFRIFVPWGRAINPITKTNWEGVGVVPDVSVPADSALEEAHRRALQELSATSKPNARSTSPLH